MLSSPGLEPIDYLVVGHLTQDLTPDGPRLGGTAAYAARTAYAMGLRVGIVTAWGQEVATDLLDGVKIVNEYADHSTTFENIEGEFGRIQKLHYLAPGLDYYHVPGIWRSAPIIHLAPVVHEVNPLIARHFPDALSLLTPQGWLRQWDENGNVDCGDWPEARLALEQVSVTILSDEDLQCDQLRIEEFAHAAKLLIVTHGENGATLYFEGQEHLVDAPKVELVDATGAGDVFAAAFIVQYHAKHDPVEALRFANQVAANSVTRPGLAGAPSEEDLHDITLEVN
jgi:sugar/nucleoside kinase (ribokinase family)